MVFLAREKFTRNKIRSSIMIRIEVSDGFALDSILSGPGSEIGDRYGADVGVHFLFREGISIQYCF